VALGVHLAVLTTAGLVQATRRGQQLVYSLTTSVLMDIATELAEMARINQPRTEANRTPARTTARVGPNPRRAPS
jgi:hypothetical protein